MAVATGVLVAGAALVLRPATDEKGAANLAPTFETFDLKGERVRLVDYRGKVVVLNFWASWCVPCRKEFPLLKQVHGGDVAVLGVVYQDSKPAAAAFMRDQGATWPGLIDPDGEIADAYGVGAKPGLPVTIAIDPEGSLVRRHIGELRRGDLEGLIALAKGSPP